VLEEKNVRIMHISLPVPYVVPVPEMNRFLGASGVRRVPATPHPAGSRPSEEDERHISGGLKTYILTYSVPGTYVMSK